MFFHRGFIWIMLVGLFVLYGAPGLRHRGDYSSDTIDDTAFLGGVNRRIQSDDFRGGQATAFMGGIKLDLRDAHTTKDEVVVEATAIMGGVDITVPRDWEVQTAGTSILGGFEDRRSTFRDGSKHGPRLIVQGTAIMGGVRIRN